MDALVRSFDGSWLSACVVGDPFAGGGLVLGLESY
jgi:hypothetical protein